MTRTLGAHRLVFLQTFKVWRSLLQTVFQFAWFRGDEGQYTCILREDALENELPNFFFAGDL